MDYSQVLVRSLLVCDSSLCSLWFESSVYIDGCGSGAMSCFAGMLQAVRQSIASQGDRPPRRSRRALEHAHACRPPPSCALAAVSEAHTAPLAAQCVEEQPREDEIDLASNDEEVGEPDESLLECPVFRVAWEGSPALCCVCGEQVYGVVVTMTSGAEMHYGCSRWARLRI